MTQFKNEKQANDFIQDFGREFLDKANKRREEEKSILDNQFEITNKIRKEVYDKILEECKGWVTALDAQIKMFEEHITDRESLMYQLYCPLLKPFDPRDTDSEMTTFYALSNHTRFTKFLRDVINNFGIAVAKAGYYLPGEESEEDEDKEEGTSTEEKILSTMKRLVELLKK